MSVLAEVIQALVILFAIVASVVGLIRRPRLLTAAVAVVYVIAISWATLSPVSTAVPESLLFLFLISLLFLLRQIGIISDDQTRSRNQKIYRTLFGKRYEASLARMRERERVAAEQNISVVDVLKQEHAKASKKPNAS